MFAACAPIPPSNDSVRAIPGDQWAILSFDTNVANQQYEIETLPGGAKQMVASSPALIGGLTNGDSYTFRVRTQGTDGTWTGWSAESPPVTPSGPVPAPSPPGAPTLVSVTRIVSVTDCTAVLHFAAPGSDGGNPITGYLVTAPRISADPIPVGTSSPADVAGLARGASSTFTIRAVTAAGAGAPSNEITRDCPA